MRRSLMSVLAVLAFSTSLAAQSGPNKDCALTIRVRTMDERSVATLVQVQLLTTEDIVVGTRSLNNGEPAEFQVGNGQTYRLSITGNGIEPVNTYFEINPLEPSHTEIIHVAPDLKNVPGKTAQGAASVSVSELMIPTKAGAEMKKGLAAYTKGDMEKASAQFQKAVAAYPRYARAYDLLGVIAIRKPDRAKAREFFSKSIQVDNTYAPAYVDLARMDFQDKEYTETEALLQKAISMNPSMPDAMALLAASEFSNKEYDKALADVQRMHALQNHEQFAEVHLMAGRVLRMQHHPQQAIEQFQLFLAEKPKSPEAEGTRRAIAQLEAGQQH